MKHLLIAILSSFAFSAFVHADSFRVNDSNAYSQEEADQNLDWRGGDHGDRNGQGDSVGWDNHENRCRDQWGREIPCYGPPAHHYPPPPPQQPGAEYIRCESFNQRYSECFFGARRVRSVSLQQQHSSAPCIAGRTYGFMRDRVWVNGGCRATFFVQYGY